MWGEALRRDHFSKPEHKTDLIGAQANDDLGAAPEHRKPSESIEKQNHLKNRFERAWTDLLRP